MTLHAGLSRNRTCSLLTINLQISQEILFATVLDEIDNVYCPFDYFSLYNYCR
jgi:hypothetical protein